MVRAGVSPSAAAAACSEVVLNGIGGGNLLLLFLTAVTVPLVWPATASMARVASAALLKRLVACMAANSAAPEPRERNAPFTVQ